MTYNMMIILYEPTNLGGSSVYYPPFVLSCGGLDVDPDSRPSYTSLSAGGSVSVSWLYVGENDLFDIYLRQNGVRVSDNLCAGEADGSCKITSPEGAATVTLPSEIENSGDYRLLVRPGCLPSHPVPRHLRRAHALALGGLLVLPFFVFCSPGSFFLRLLLSC